MPIGAERKKKRRVFFVPRRFSARRFKKSSIGETNCSRFFPYRPQTGKARARPIDCASWTQRARRLVSVAFLSTRRESRRGRPRRVRPRTPPRAVQRTCRSQPRASLAARERRRASPPRGARREARGAPRSRARVTSQPPPGPPPPPRGSSRGPPRAPASSRAPSSSPAARAATCARWRTSRP